MFLEGGEDLICVPLVKIEVLFQIKKGWIQHPTDITLSIKTGKLFGYGDI